MTKTKDAVANWINLMINGVTQDRNHPCRACSCHAVGYYFVSYDTPVAKFCGDHFEVSTRKYSPTTSKLQTLLRFKSGRHGMLKEVDEIKDNGEFPWRR